MIPDDRQGGNDQRIVIELSKTHGRASISTAYNQFQDKRKLRVRSVKVPEDRAGRIEINLSEFDFTPLPIYFGGFLAVWTKYRLQINPTNPEKTELTKKTITLLGGAEKFTRRETIFCALEAF